MKKQNEKTNSKSNITILFLNATEGVISNLEIRFHRSKRVGTLAARCPAESSALCFSGAVNTQDFMWKLLCAIFKLSFLHSFIPNCDRPQPL